MIEVEDLEKLYGDFPAVRGLSFRVQPGEVLGLVGPNGAGKTTTIRSIAGIIIPSRGRIRIGDHDLTQEPVAAKSLLAFIPDEPHLFDYLTVEEHLRFVGRLYQVADAESRIPGLLEEMELAAKRSALPGRTVARDEAEARDRLRSAASATGAAAWTSRSPGLDPVGHPPDEGDYRPARRGGHRRHPQLSPAPPRRGDLHPSPGDERRAGGRLRHHPGDRGEPPRRCTAAGWRMCSWRLITPNGAATRVIRVFAYLAWRSAYNRGSPSAPPAPESALPGRARARA